MISIEVRTKRQKIDMKTWLANFRGEDQAARFEGV
jgi:hypothetical protein